MDWLGLLVIQGTLKSLFQRHSLKASILRCSAFFTIQLSHPYMTTGKTIALTRQTLVSKVMSLLLNMLSRLVITFLPRSKCLNFMAAVTICSDFGAPKNKVWHCFHCSVGHKLSTQRSAVVTVIPHALIALERKCGVFKKWIVSRLLYRKRTVLSVSQWQPPMHPIGGALSNPSSVNKL